MKKKKKKKSGSANMQIEIKASIEKLKSKFQYRIKSAFHEAMGEMQLIERKSKNEDGGEEKVAFRLQS